MNFDETDGEQLISVVASYAPNEDSPQFFKQIGELLKTRSEHKVIIGDFNLALNIELDRENTYHNNNKARDEVENIMEQYFMTDIWRERNPEKREFTWIKKGTYPVKSKQNRPCPHIRRS